jgi:hypothetical protein
MLIIMLKQLSIGLRKWCPLLICHPSHLHSLALGVRPVSTAHTWVYVSLKAITCTCHICRSVSKCFSTKSSKCRAWLVLSGHLVTSVISCDFHRVLMAETCVFFSFRLSQMSTRSLVSQVLYRIIMIKGITTQPVGCSWCTAYGHAWHDLTSHMIVPLE